MTKLAPEWIRTSDPVIRSPARYHWTTPPTGKDSQEANSAAKFTIAVIPVLTDGASCGVWNCSKSESTGLGGGGGTTEVGSSRLSNDPNCSGAVGIYCQCLQCYGKNGRVLLGLPGCLLKLPAITRQSAWRPVMRHQCPLS